MDWNEKNRISDPGIWPEARTDKSGAQGFNASGVLYLITHDRFANVKPENDNGEDVAVIRQSPNARCGVDLDGITKRVGYMKDPGITTVWLYPIQENKMRSGSTMNMQVPIFIRWISV